MWNKRKEDLAMFNICRLVRDQLNKEHETGAKMDDIVQRLIGFYQVTSPRLANALLKNPMSVRTSHTSNVMRTHIVIHVAADEQIDYKVMREYLTATWPDMDVEGAINPNTVTYRDKDGNVHEPKVFDLTPAMKIMLEKDGFTGRANQPLDIDASKPVQHSYVDKLNKESDK